MAISMLLSKQAVKHINPKEFKAIVIEALNEARLKETQARGTVTKAIFDEKIKFFERVCIFIAKYETEEGYGMEQLRSDLIKETVRLDDILPRRREGVLEPKILKIADQLKTNPDLAGLVDDKAITWGNLSNYVSRMHRRGTLSRDIRAIKRQEKFYLVFMPDHATAKKK